MAINFQDLYTHELNLATSQKVKYESFTDQSMKETTVYKTKNKKLVFVAAKHTIGNDKFLDFLMKILENTSPEIILLEIPKTTKNSIKYLKNPKTKWSEREFLIDYAFKNNVAAYGMDSNDKNYWSYPFSIKNQFVTNHKQAMRLGILLELLFKYNQYKNDPTLFKKSKSHLYELCMLDISHELFVREIDDERKAVILEIMKKAKGQSILKSINVICQASAKKYSGLSLNSLLEEMANYNMATFKNYKLHKLIIWWDTYRNINMIKECIKHLENYNTIVAVAGNWHINVLRDFLSNELKNKFGKVEVQSWYDYCKGIVRNASQ